MAPLQPQKEGIPLPRPTMVSQPYWDGCREGKLLYQRCDDCGAITMDPSPVCASCTSPNLSWEQSEGVGTVYSWTVVWRPQTPAFEVPYAAAIVDLDEGFPLLSNVIGCEPDEVEVGMRVTVRFVAIDDEITLPYFEPLG